ncbi:MAG: PKD domain-containing protein, partial [Bacteroidota bacterium]
QGLDILWSTGETSPSITITASGAYSVIVTNPNGCESYDSIGVQIAPLPVAGFILTDTVVNSGLTVSFANTSSFGSYIWNFGDGNSSSATSPSHMYADTGTYCVELIVQDILNFCGNDTFEQCFVLLENAVSIGDLLPDNSFVFFPNPATDHIAIEALRDHPDRLMLRLIGLDGRILQQEVLPTGLRSGSRYQLPLQNLPNGLYQLQLVHQQKSFTKTISILR